MRRAARRGGRHSPAGAHSTLFTIIKQHGALLAKGRLLGIQFDTLFTDGLYERIGADAVRYADAIRRAMAENGYLPCFPSPTNQSFCMFSSFLQRK